MMEPVAKRARTSPYAMTPMDDALRFSLELLLHLDFRLWEMTLGSLSFSVCVCVLVKEETPVLPITSVGIRQARGTVLAQDVRSKEDLPPFHASIMDGYAVIGLDPSLHFGFWRGGG